MPRIPFFRLSTILMLGALLSAPLLSARADNYPCRGLAVVAPQINLSMGQVTEDRNRTIDQLSALSRQGAISTHSLGLSTSKLGYSLAIRVAVKTQRIGRAVFACASIDELRVDVSLTERVVHIARELQANRCAFNFVREHEYNHQKVDVAAVRKLADELRQRLTLVIQSEHRRKGRDPEQLVQTMQRNVEYETQRIWQNLVRDRERAQAYLDRPGGDYAQVGLVCNGVIPRILRRR